jgi:predicted ATP-grasp superfamily ATP-dependent carboligase
MAVTTAPAGVDRVPGDALATAPVLIGFADALAAPETAWSLLGSGRPVVAFARRGSRPALRRCKGVELVEITPPEQDAAQAVSELRALLQCNDYVALMPLDDAAVWLCSAACEDQAIPLVGPSGETALLALDKRLQLAAATRAGFRVPPTQVVETVDDLLALSDLPVQLKPAQPMMERDGRLVRGGNFVCGDRDELMAAARAWNGAHPLLAQPLLDGVGEGLFGLAGPDGVHAWSAHRRIRMMNPHGSGSSACASAPVEEELARAAERMLLDVGWNGLFMVEILRSRDGVPWFMELNGRPWGSMALARRSGLEYPAWALSRRLDPEVELPPAPPAQTRTCRHLGRELVHLLMVLRGPKSDAVAHWPSRRRAARDVLTFRRDDDWYNWHPRNPGLFVEDTLRTVLDQLPRKLTPWRGSA